MNNFHQQCMDGSPAYVHIGLWEVVTPEEAARLQTSTRFDPVISIKFQCGPIKEVGRNGCQLDDVIDVLVARLEGFQKGPFKSEENARAIAHLVAGKEELLQRTRRRREQGVEGTNAAHRS